MPPVGQCRVAEHAGDPGRGEIKGQHAVGIKAQHAFEPVAQSISSSSGTSPTQLRNAGFDLGGRNRREKQLVATLVEPPGYSWSDGRLAGGEGAQNVGVE